MLDTLIMATALLASQGGYNMPPAAPPMPRPERRATTTQAPAPPPQPAVPAVPGKTLADLPNTTITYFDVSGRNLKAINKSIVEHQKIGPGGRPAVAPTGWAIDAGFNKVTSGGQCKVANAKATFSAKVVMPRLVSDTGHTPELLATWRAYLAGVENAQAADLWFVYDRIRDVESAILASTCEGAQSAGAAAVERLRAQAAEFRRSNASAQAAK